MSIVLTKKQEEGLKIAVNRYKEGKPYTCISGYAGTGKSTLINHIIAALGFNEDQVRYVAYTGKAAKVLQEKGCKNAVTAHKLLYHSKLLPNGAYIYTPVLKLDPILEIIVVDEISMLPKKMWNLLLSHNIYVLAVGDPYQLPPINKNEDNEVLNNPHIFLDEIMRQALDSEIIRLSMWIREGKLLKDYKAEGTEVQIYNKNQLSIGMLEWADQVICATNKQREFINSEVRRKKNRGEEPEVGDKIISLKNHWNDFSRVGNLPLTNGTIGYISDFMKTNEYLPKYITENSPIVYMYTTMITDDGEDKFSAIPIDYKYLMYNKNSLTTEETYKILKNKNLPISSPPYEFTYAYAITCHKAQGSQWNKVLVTEENFPFDKEEHSRWLYTAITRAIGKVVIIKK